MYYIYILSSISRVLYTGVTNSLYSRVKRHKAAEDPKAFTARYNIHRLVYFEEYQSRQKAGETDKALAEGEKDSID